MKKIKTLLIFIIPALVGFILALSCATQRAAVAARSGAQIWGENCIRCHNTPSPAVYNDSDWETIGLHMRIRANLTAEETIKAIDFLKSANGD